MSDEWQGPDGGDLNELDRDAAHFEATHDGADWTDVEPECGAWNWSHTCRLPGDHAGDHRCVGCGDVWNPGPDDHDESFVNDYDGATCEEELGPRYTLPETPEERRIARLAMSAITHNALTTTRGARGHEFGRDRTGEHPCATCEALDREAAALRAIRERWAADEFSGPPPF